MTSYLGDVPENLRTVAVCSSAIENSHIDNDMKEDFYSLIPIDVWKDYNFLKVTVAKLEYDVEYAPQSLWGDAVFCLNVLSND